MREVFAALGLGSLRAGFGLFVKALRFALAVLAGFGAPGVADAASVVFDLSSVAVTVETLLPELVPMTIRPVCKSM